MSELPVISIVMAVHDGMPYVIEAIESILHQTYGNYELIIVDDASSDGTLDAIMPFEDVRVVLLALEDNVGQTKALNHGLAAARGELVARMDADDISLPQRFERQVNFLLSHQEVALVGTAAYIIDQNGMTVGEGMMENEDRILKWHLLFGNRFFHPSLMWRRMLVEERVGRFDERYVPANDYEFITRVADCFMVANMSEKLIKYRRHAQAMGVVQDARQHREAQEISSRQIKALFRGERTPPTRWLRDIGVLEPQNIPLEQTIESLRNFRATYERYSEVNNILPDADGNVYKRIRRHAGCCVAQLLKRILKEDRSMAIRALKEVWNWDKSFVPQVGGAIIQATSRKLVRF